MGKPFQFSLRRMFLAVACLSVTAWTVCTFFKHAYEPEMGPAEWLSLYFGAFISCGAGLGAISGNAIRGALWGTLCAIIVVACLMLLPIRANA